MIRVISKSFILGSDGKDRNLGKILGNEYTILKAVMMVEGAYSPFISGSEETESIFFEAGEMKKSTITWNGRPVALNHPPGNVSCNTPTVFDNQWLGFVFNSEFNDNDKRLICDMWLDSERASDIIDRVYNGGKIDVSIGAYGNLEDSPGYFNNKQYSKRITSVVGDHLALLPDSIGACSWDDGCGIRAKKKYSYDIKIEDGGSMKKETRDVESNKCEEIRVSAEKPSGNEEVSVEEYVKSAPESIRAILKDQLDTYEALKHELISNITSFEEVKFENNFLSSLSSCQLGKISRLVDIAYKYKSEAVKKNEKENVSASEKISDDNSLNSKTNFGVVSSENNNSDWSVPREIDWS